MRLTFSSTGDVILSRRPSNWNGLVAATLYLLDTNTVSFIIRGDARLLGRLQALPVTAVAISCITEAELLYGLASKPDAKALAAAVTAFLRDVQALP